MQWVVHVIKPAETAHKADESVAVALFECGIELMGKQREFTGV